MYRTPLHCAAANNDIIIVQYLIENGACIFATTALHNKTPVDCCETSLPGYKECVLYLEGNEQITLIITQESKLFLIHALRILDLVFLLIKYFFSCSQLPSRVSL